jgi:enamine deaminase RidA (YjgF/YER057c/UK114 family)
VTLQRVNPTGLPAAHGFSHAVVGSGTVVFLAGQTALDVDGQIVGDTVVAQFERALANLLAALAAAGGQPEQLASLTIYLVDVVDYRDRAGEIGDVWRRLVGRSYPATAAVGVTRLWDEAALVEVQGVAIVSPPPDAGR